VKNTHNSIAILIMTLVFTLITSALAFGQGGKKPSGTDREKLGLIGAVKTVRTTKVEHFGTSLSPLTSIDSMTFSESGNVLERVEYGESGDLISTESRIYDKQGVLTENSWRDAKGKITAKEVYSYLNGRLVQTQTYDAAGISQLRTVNIYDQKNRLIEEVIYHSKKPELKTVYKYDDKDNQIEVAYYLPNGRKAEIPHGPPHRTTTVYNDKAQVIGRSAFQIDGTLWRNDLYTHDERGNISENIVENGNTIYRYFYKYEFDPKGNWTKRTITGEAKFKPGTHKSEFFEQPKPEVTTRGITYY